MKKTMLAALVCGLFGGTGVVIAGDLDSAAQSFIHELQEAGSVVLESRIVAELWNGGFSMQECSKYDEPCQNSTHCCGNLVCIYYSIDSDLGICRYQE
jgi:hypothetical protein